MDVNTLDHRAAKVQSLTSTVPLPVTAEILDAINDCHEMADSIEKEIDRLFSHLLGISEPKSEAELGCTTPLGGVLPLAAERTKYLRNRLSDILHSIRRSAANA